MADRDSNTSKTIGSTSNDVETVYDNVGMQSDPNTGQGLMSVSDSAVVIKGHATYETKIITIIYY